MGKPHETMVTLKAVGKADKALLWNLFQKYCYEMSACYDLEMDAEGNYVYPYFDACFEEERRIAYFLLADGRLVGFAMLNAFSCLDDDIDHAIAEFTVFPRYRRRRLARAAVRQIFRKHPGAWEIKFSANNPTADAFWREATAPYAPRVTPVGNEETVLSFRV